MRNRKTRLVPLLFLVASSLAASSPDVYEQHNTNEPEVKVDTVRKTAPVARPETSPEVVVILSDDLIPWLEAENWWGSTEHLEQLDVPHVMIAAIKPAWKTRAAKLPVEVKKELFYRLMLPLVMHANTMVMTRRNGLFQAQEELTTDGAISMESLFLVQDLAQLLPDYDATRIKLLSPDSKRLPGMIDELLYRVDIVPPGLALGQAAYESGYGTSRFAVEGNALFGQWTYGGEGIKPRGQRANKGDYRIKAFDWPFDSVRSYFINLMSHRAYEDFRRLRAEMRAAGQPLDSLTLADGLTSYSERGQIYVDKLKGMIRSHGLEIADKAVFRDEPIRFIVTEQTPGEAEATRKELAKMRESGELADIFERMYLD